MTEKENYSKLLHVYIGSPDDLPVELKNFF